MTKGKALSYKSLLWKGDSVIYQCRSLDSGIEKEAGKEWVWKVI